MGSRRSTRVPARSALIAVAQLALALCADVASAADLPSITLPPAAIAGPVETSDRNSAPCVGDADGDGEVQVDELVEAVSNALSGCPDSDPARLQLTLRVVRSEDGSELRVVAELRKGGGATVTYLRGCSALCRPALYDPIYFTVIGPSGAEVFIERPCSGPFFCAPFSAELAAGESLEQQLRITGTQWEQEGANLFYCGECTEQPLPGGRYTVVARFLYSSDVVQGFPPPLQIVALTEFTWP